MPKQHLLTLFLFISILLISCQTKNNQSNITKAELKEMIDDCNKVDLYTAVSLSEIATSMTGVRIFVLEQMLKLDPENFEYDDQLQQLQQEYTRRKEYQQSLYDKVQEE